MCKYFSRSDVRKRVKESEMGKEVNSLWSRLLSLGVVLLLTASQVGGAELTAHVLSGYSVPYFLMWLHGSFQLITLPMFVLAFKLASCCQKVRPIKWDLLREQWVRYLVLQVIFYTLYVGANVCYVWALSSISPGLVAALFGSCSAMVAIMSFFVLGTGCSAWKVASVVFASMGVPLVALGGGSGSGEVVGVVLALMAALFAATYKVAFAVFLGRASVEELGLFLSLLGLVNVTVGMVPLVLMGYFGVETAFWTLEGVDWNTVMGGTVLTWLFNFCIAFGITITSPLYISIGVVLSIPLTMLTDVVINGKSLPDPAMGWAGAALIVISFVAIAVEEMSCNPKKKGLELQDPSAETSGPEQPFIAKDCDV